MEHQTLETINQNPHHPNHPEHLPSRLTSREMDALAKGAAPDLRVAPRPGARCPKCHRRGSAIFCPLCNPDAPRMVGKRKGPRRSSLVPRGVASPGPTGPDAPTGSTGPTGPRVIEARAIDADTCVVVEEVPETGEKVHHYYLTASISHALEIHARECVLLGQGEPVQVGTVKGASGVRS